MKTEGIALGEILFLKHPNYPAYSWKEKLKVIKYSCKIEVFSKFSISQSYVQVHAL